MKCRNRQIHSKRRQIRDLQGLEKRKNGRLFGEEMKISKIMQKIEI
jgi:hypothetical protein